jgi:hypothetical protein
MQNEIKTVVRAREEEENLNELVKLKLRHFLIFLLLSCLEKKAKKVFSLSFLRENYCFMDKSCVSSKEREGEGKSFFCLGK